MSRLANLRSLASMTALVLVAMPLAAWPASAPTDLAPLDLAPSVLRDAAAASARPADGADGVRVDRGDPGSGAQAAKAFDALRPACHRALSTAVALAAVATCVKTTCTASPTDVPRDVIPTYRDTADRRLPHLASCPPRTFRLW